MVLPVLCERRGSEAMELLSGAESVRKAKALITLHELAPEDGETLAELCGLRQLLAQLWLDVDDESREALYTSSVGDVTCQLIRSGFGAVLVDAEDEEARQQLKHCAEQLDISQETHQGLIFASLLYFPANNIHFEEVEDLPSWLVEALGSF